MRLYLASQGFSHVDRLRAMMGGNCFVLRRAMRQSGIDDVLKDELSNDTFVYGGSSAGSIMATPSLLGVENADDPTEIPAGYDKEVIWDGLGLIDTHLVPHFGSVWFDAESKKLVRALKERGVSYTTLRDGEALVIDGTAQEHLR